jgi:hypothetical protein
LIVAAVVFIAVFSSCKGIRPENSTSSGNSTQTSSSSGHFGETEISLTSPVKTQPETQQTAQSVSDGGATTALTLSKKHFAGSFAEFDYLALPGIYVFENVGGEICARSSDMLFVVYKFDGEFSNTDLVALFRNKFADSTKVFLLETGFAYFEGKKAVLNYLTILDGENPILEVYTLAENGKSYAIGSAYDSESGKNAANIILGSLKILP